jgi:hypothetical protein
MMSKAFDDRHGDLLEFFAISDDTIDEIQYSFDTSHHPIDSPEDHSERDSEGDDGDRESDPEEVERIDHD